VSTEDTETEDSDLKGVLLSVQIREGPEALVRALTVAASHESCIVVGIDHGNSMLSFEVFGANVPPDHEDLASVLEVLALGLRKGHPATNEERKQWNDQTPT
jgi:hypothetical protein